MAEKKYNVVGGTNHKIGRKTITNLCFERTGDYTFDWWMEDSIGNILKEQRTCWQNELPIDDTEFVAILAKKRGLELE